MKKNAPVIFIICCFYFVACKHNNKDTWVAFYNKDTTLVGFKDQHGQIEVQPRFSTFGTARKFDDIVAVSELKNKKFINYYFTKKGKAVGRDSVFYFDNTPDCESEGFIRFQDRKSLKMGLINAKGDVAIPAIYNYLFPVRNGIMLALTGAIRQYPTDPDEEHFNPWLGGTEVLVNTSNKTLIHNFPYDDDIDFYSMTITDEPVNASAMKTFKGINGQYYSFISFEKEFNNWFNNQFLNSITMDKLLKQTYDKLTIATDTGGRLENKENYIKVNFDRLKSKLIQLKNPEKNYDVVKGQLNPYDDSSKPFAEYFDNCGMYKDWLYPVMQVSVKQESSDWKIRQEGFEFVRTPAGYKLIGINIY